MGANPQVIIADEPAFLLQCCPDFSVCFCSPRVKLLNWDVLNQFLQLGESLGLLATLARTVVEFSISNCRHDQLSRLQSLETGPDLRWPVFGDVYAHVRIQHVARLHSASRFWGGWSCRPWDIKSFGMAASAANARPRLRFGSLSTISSPRRRISTSSTSKRNCFGKRTAWLLPDLKIRAVFITIASSLKYTP